MVQAKAGQIAYIIKNGDYSDRRQIEGQEGFGDLIEDVTRDGIQVKKSLKTLFGFKASEIREVCDASF